MGKMKTRLKQFALIIVLLAPIVALGLTSPRDSRAQSGGSYDLTWNSIDGGGGTSVGGGYSLSGTIGQPDAGTMSGGAYTLNGGFWVDLMGNKLNLPLIMR